MIESTCKIEEETVQAVRIVYENTEHCAHISYTQEWQSKLSEQ